MTSNIWRVLDIFELQGRSIFDENISEANCRKFPSSVVDLHFTALIIEQSSKHKLQTAAEKICRISELVPSEPPAPKFRIPSSPQTLLSSPARPTQNVSPQISPPPTLLISLVSTACWRSISVKGLATNILRLITTPCCAHPPLALHHF